MEYLEERGRQIMLRIYTFIIVILYTYRQLCFSIDIFPLNGPIDWLTNMALEIYKSQQ